MSVREILERALCESIFDCPPEDANADEISTISKAASGVLAALDAEGVGLPWVSVDVRRPTLADADSTGRVLWSGPGMPTNCALFRLEMSAYTHWLPPSAIPVPGQSGAPEPAAQPEARTDREFACDKCGASAWLPAGTVRCGAPECGVRALTTTENER